MVLRRCRNLLKEEEMALDAMQDVFVKVLRRQDFLKEEYPSSLLYTIATNHCLNILKKEGRLSPGDEVLNRIVSEEHLEETILNRLFLDQLFGSQLATTRTIAVLHYRDGLTLEETAWLTTLSVSGVRRRLRKLREAGFILEGRTE